MLQIGERIQEYRKNLGFSQEEFAEKIGDEHFIRVLEA